MVLGQGGASRAGYVSLLAAAAAAWGCGQAASGAGTGGTGGLAESSSGAASVSSMQSGAGGALSSGSGGVLGTSAGSGGIDAGLAGMPAEPPLFVDPVAVWGGRPLDMLPYAMSGTRLAAVGYVDEGAVVFKTMRDTELGFDCTFEQSEAGDWLCSPNEKHPLLFLDASCTEPAVETAPFGEPTGQIFGFAEANASEPIGRDTVLVSKHVQAYRVEDVVFQSTGRSPYAEDGMSLYALNLNKKCVGPRTANWKVVTVPPSIYRVLPVADTELVKATIRNFPLKEGVTLERLVTADGAEFSGNLKIAGQRCELQRDGRCVPSPIAEPQAFADPDCKESAFSLPIGATAGAKVYGVERALAPDDTTKVYELTPFTFVYYQQYLTETVTENGQTMTVNRVVGCEGSDRSSDAAVHYRRTRDFTDQTKQLGTVQLGSAALLPTWFFGVASGNDTRIQVQIHSPNGGWVKPNVGVRDGGVCSFYDERYPDVCLGNGAESVLGATEQNL